LGCRGLTILTGPKEVPELTDAGAEGSAPASAAGEERRRRVTPAYHRALKLSSPKLV